MTQLDDNRAALAAARDVDRWFAREGSVPGWLMLRLRLALETVPSDGPLVGKTVRVRALSRGAWGADLSGCSAVVVRHEEPWFLLAPGPEFCGAEWWFKRDELELGEESSS